MAKRLFLMLAMLCFSGALSSAATPTPQSDLSEWFPDEDRKAYEFLLSSYQKQDLPQLKTRYLQFAKDFPDSSLRDNALFLVAQLMMEKGQWKESLKPLNGVLKSQLTSERWPAAIYGKGLAYQKLGQEKLAEKQWKILLKRFPGSKESQKAWVALRLMSTEKRVN